MLRRQRSSKSGILELFKLPTGGFFGREPPTLALQEINGDSSGNNHLMNEESIGGIVILSGITSS
jgi:hypothetical protein